MKGWKQIALALSVLGICIFVDFQYVSGAEMASGQGDMQGAFALIQMRPIVLIVAYTALIIVGYRFLSLSHHLGISTFLLLLGLTTSLLIASPPRVTDFAGLYDPLVKLSGSSLGLSLHAASLVSAVGLIRIFDSIRFSRNS